MHKNSDRETCATNKLILFVRPNQAGSVMLK